MVNNAKEAANAYFKKAQTVQGGAQPKTQYETDACAVREKAARLKSLRLAELETVVKPIADQSAKRALRQRRCDG